MSSHRIPNIPVTDDDSFHISSVWASSSSSICEIEPSFQASETSEVFRALAKTIRSIAVSDGSPSQEARTFTVPIAQCFYQAKTDFDLISVDQDIMGGAPCLTGTRFPVHVVLDALQSYESVDAVLKAYPRWTREQVTQAIGFSRTVIECPVECQVTIVD